MGFGNVNGCPNASTYEWAKEVWSKAPAPRTIKQLNTWDMNARPLDDIRKWHYRIERRPNDAYAVCLYHQTMAIHYPPEKDGACLTEYTWDSRATSTQFLWRVVDVGRRNKNVDLDGKEVWWMLGNGNLPGKTVCARIVRIGRHIDTERSEILAPYTWATSPERTRARKECVKAFEDLIFIALMQTEMPTEWAPRYVYRPPLDRYDARSIAATGGNVGERMRALAALVSAVKSVGEAPPPAQRKASMYEAIRNTLHPKGDEKKYVQLWTDPPRSAIV